MDGLSGTYAFNNVDFTLPPSTGKWVTRTSYGFSGDAHPIYSQFRNFELKWELISMPDLKQVIDFYNLVGSTGTVTSCLPEYGSVDYRFKNYSGTTLSEPELGEFFQGYVQSVTLLVVNAKTN